MHKTGTPHQAGIVRGAMIWSLSLGLLSCLGLSTAAPNQAAQQQPITVTPHASYEISSASIRDVLKENEIIDQVLDDFVPEWSIELTYPSHHHQVLLGNTIKVSHAKHRPVFTFRKFGNGYQNGRQQQLLQQQLPSEFALVLTDPDALSRDKPSKSEMCHWIITNLTTPVFDPIWWENLVPLELVEYLPPGPPPKTGPHRYVFVLLELTKPGKKLKAPTERPHWGYGKERHGVRDWAKENELKVVGANFFFAENEKQ